MTGTNNEHIENKSLFWEVVMVHRAVGIMQDVAELAALAAFLAMIAMVARSLGG